MCIYIRNFKNILTNSALQFNQPVAIQIKMRILHAMKQKGRKKEGRKKEGSFLGNEDLQIKTKIVCFCMTIIELVSEQFIDSILHDFSERKLKLYPDLKFIFHFIRIARPQIKNVALYMRDTSACDKTLKTVC